MRDKDFTVYKNRLIHAFPKYLEADVEAVILILPVQNIREKLPAESVENAKLLFSVNDRSVLLDNEPLTIPYRVYFDEPDPETESKLTETQKKIVNCIYLRHYDGYLRQRRLEKLYAHNEYWIIPFKLQLLGEYVLAILQDLDKHITGHSLASYAKFAKENPKYWYQTECRIRSYWHQSFKWQFPDFTDYIGKRIAERINACNNAE